YSFFYNNGFSGFNDLQVANGRLFMQISGGDGNPMTYYYYEHGGKDTIYQSSQNTNIESYSNLPSTFRLEYFKNQIYVSGTSYHGASLRENNNTIKAKKTSPTISAVGPPST